MNERKQRGWLRDFISEPIRTVALGIIVLCSFVAIFAFVFTKDKSPDINEQIPAIGLKNPGFSVDLLKIKKSATRPDDKWLKKMFTGQENEFRYIPVMWHAFNGDSVFYKVYEEDIQPDMVPVESAHIAAIWSGAEQTLSIVKDNNQYIITDFNNHTRTVDIATLQQDVQYAAIEHRTFWLGTDLFGRSLADRIILGVRYSLLIGLLAVTISITIGATIGMIAGYFGGRADDILSYVMNVFWSIPTLILVFAIVMVMGRGIQNIFIAVGVTMWVDAARLVRGQVLSMKREKFVESAQSMGLSSGRIMARHILPNMLGPLIVIAVSNFASAIIVESGLSYLGFGIQPPAPSLGSIISENYGFVLSGKPMLAVAPVLVLLILVLSFNLVGNGVRDIFDVKSNL